MFEDGSMDKKTLLRVVDPVDYSSSKITLIQYGTMVINLWFKEHNICFLTHMLNMVCGST